MDEITKFINEIDCISNARKEFYEKIIHIRYENIKAIFTDEF